VNVGGNWNIINAAGQFANPGSGFVTAGRGIVGALSGAGTTIQGQTQIGDASVGGTLKALESAGVSRVLAEPTLVTVSGESANFLVGGEVPITIGCGVAACTPTVQFKQYGIQLTFTPIVLSEGRISLRVSTEVSEIDRENADASTGTPGFRTRKQSTSVELPSGATMMTAGLISSQPSQTISGVPGLINLPVLGALFRSRNYQRRESELVITVTPFIAKPMEAAQVRRPDDGFVESHDGEAVLLGRLNKLYGVAGPGSAAAARPTGAKAGRFGFITD
jgi:pilus assembly protein CpaC